MAGNDLANLRTTAIYDPDTDEYVVNGSEDLDQLGPPGHLGPVPAADRPDGD